MVQILEPGTQNKTFGQRLNQGIGRGLESAELLAEKYRQQQAQTKSNSAASRLAGNKDVADLSPKLQETYLDKVLNRQNKQAEIADQLKSDKEFENELFGTNNEKDEFDLPKEKNKNQPRWKTMTDEEVAKLKLRDPKKGKVIEDLRNPKNLASNQPMSQEQSNIMQSVRKQPGFDDLDELGQYNAYVDSGLSPINAERAAKLKTPQLTRHATAVEKSYNQQKEFIDSTTNKYNAFESEMKPRLLAMQNLNDNELVSPTQEMFLDALGIPLGTIERPESELYHKLSQDLLKGLPETYGSRILKVEVDNFLKTIPTLSNSVEGRRMIASNLLKLGEMKEAYYKEMRRQQKGIEGNDEPYPRDFQQNVLDNVMPQISRINNEFQQLSTLTHVPKGKVPFFNPQGTISFIPKDNPEDMQWALDHGGKRIW